MLSPATGESRRPRIGLALGGSVGAGLSASGARSADFVGADEDFAPDAAGAAPAGAFGAASAAAGDFVAAAASAGDFGAAAASAGDFGAAAAVAAPCAGLALDA